MGIIGKRYTHSPGFTLVEVLVVIFIIGVLAGIYLLTFPNAQQHARDTQRQSDLQQIAAALSAYDFQKNNYMSTGSNCGLNGNGNGWLNAGPSDTGAGSYPEAIISCLQDANLLSSGTSFTDPSGCRWASGGSCGSTNGNVLAYMKATCTKSGVPVTYLFAHLEQGTSNNSVIDALCDSGSVSGFTASAQTWGTLYGMNYYVTVK